MKKLKHILIIFSLLLMMIPTNVHAVAAADSSLGGGRPTETENEKENITAAKPQGDAIEVVDDNMFDKADE